jgi:hypothetical protein
MAGVMDRLEQLAGKAEQGDLTIEDLKSIEDLLRSPQISLQRFTGPVLASMGIETVAAGTTSSWQYNSFVRVALAPADSCEPDTIEFCRQQPAPLDFPSPHNVVARASFPRYGASATQYLINRECGTQFGWDADTLTAPGQAPVPYLYGVTAVYGLESEGQQDILQGHVLTLMYESTGDVNIVTVEVPASAARTAEDCIEPLLEFLRSEQASGNLRTTSVIDGKALLERSGAVRVEYTNLRNVERKPLFLEDLGNLPVCAEFECNFRSDYVILRDEEQIATFNHDFFKGFHKSINEHLPSMQVLQADTTNFTRGRRELTLNGRPFNQSSRKFFYFETFPSETPK